MKAVGKYIVIEPIKEIDVQTKGGLILAEKQREDVRYRRAKVIEPGSDVSVLKKDDEIYYDRSSGFNIEINKEEYKVIKEFDVVIIV
jgi:co-chaperonin GroES (HSP10)|tara:strand:- start:75 stop:335 length:261 start_codon:yes stop_codon:yes gene_type:complete